MSCIESILVVTIAFLLIWIARLTGRGKASNSFHTWLLLAFLYVMLSYFVLAIAFVLAFHQLTDQQPVSTFDWFVVVALMYGGVGLLLSSMLFSQMPYEAYHDHRWKTVTLWPMYLYHLWRG